MILAKTFTRATTTLMAALLLVGCNNYDPVAASECDKVVSHTLKVLGNFAPSYGDAMKDCKAATDSERGCAMAATKKGKIAQCF